MRYRFASVLVDLPEFLTDEVISWGYDNVPPESLFSDPARPLFGRPEDAHITVLYGIHARDAWEVATLAATEQEFECTLGRLEVFSRNPLFDVLVVGVRPGPIHGLNARLRKHLEATESYPQFAPHVTVAYLRKGEGGRWAGDGTFDGEEFKVREVVYSSRTDEKTPIPLVTDGKATLAGPRQNPRSRTPPG